jgi:Protein of unknown function (DUF1553)/Protein of unknown function (DUF1549)/Concanavalin A-like lectin/glucanases superfamily
LVFRGSSASRFTRNFVASELEKISLQVNPPEETRRFHRRLSFDLTGLPPSSAATDAFVKRHEVNPDQAVAEEAKAMMNTPAYAENMTRHWLDAVRYGDTHGFHYDNYRSIWPYRDWVIKAFAANMPWDQFTIDQIAGDLIPNRTTDQLIATGYNRCNPTTGEGGAIAEEYYSIYAKDQADTTSAIWLGLTVGCAACHDHKFDPISQKDFYAMTAFFRNSTMSALDENREDHPPNLFRAAIGDEAQWARMPQEISEVEKQLTARKVGVQTDFEKWAATTRLELKPDLSQSLAVHLPLNEPDGPILGKIDGKPVSWPVAAKRIKGLSGEALVVSDTPIDLGDIASFKRTDRVTYGGFIRFEGQPTGAIVAKMKSDQAFKGWDFYLQNGRPAAHVIDSWEQSANKIVAKKALDPGKWHHVMVTFDGSKNSDAVLTLYVDGVATQSKTSPNRVGENIEADAPLLLGSRSGGQSKLNASVALQDFRFYRKLLNEAQIAEIANLARMDQVLSIPVAARSKEQVDQLFSYFLAAVDTPSLKLRDQLAERKQQFEVIRSRGNVTLVMDEKKEEPFAHILSRGVYSDKKERVTADTLSELPPMPKDAPKNRLGLAKWLVDPVNPLPARVTMNRTWYYFFGTGIVETTEDFGIMGARPSHPKLLDWLASEFVSSKWDYRHMLELIVTSKTYRQSGHISPEKLEKDPQNRFLARGPRVRLDAEQLRDLALSASDLLVDQIGGPSVKPYQPDGIWEAVAMPQSNTKSYKQDKNSALYRRSLYTFWKRSAAAPSMEILNAPSRQTFCVRRDQTNTPLQALVVLNDPQFVEAARQLAANAMIASTDADQRINFITQRLLNRLPKAEEVKIIKASYEELHTSYRAQPSDAKLLIAVGETPAPDVSVTELAAWTVVASQILNLDETLTR